MKTLMDRSREIVAESFLRGAPLAQMFAKQALNASLESSFAEALTVGRGNRKPSPSQPRM